MSSATFPRLHRRPSPVVLRGIASHWPLVQQARFSDAEASRYLLEFYREAPVTAFVSQSDIGGRLFYTDDLAETNFTQTKMPAGPIAGTTSRTQGRDFASDDLHGFDGTGLLPARAARSKQPAA